MTAPMAADRAASPGFGGPNPPKNKPASGFTPLPPIRRTSTFDLLSKKKLSGDEDDGTPSPVGSSDNELPPVPPMDKGIGYQNGNGHIPDRDQGGQTTTGQLNHHYHNSTQPPPPPPQQHPALVRGPGPTPNGLAVGRGASQLNGFQQQMPMGGPVHPPQQFGQMHGQPGPLSANPGQPFVSQMGGNPIQKFPPGGQWKLEESHLSEPLIQHKSRPGANSPSQLQPNYNAYDKETEDPLPPPKGQGVPQTRPRNNSNSIPPVSAERYRNHNIFAQQSDQLPPLPSQQAGHPLLRGQANDGTIQGERGGRDAGSNKEMDYRVDEVSVSSVTSEEPIKERRGSGFFSLSGRRNMGSEPGQNHDPNVTVKDKAALFFGTVTSHNNFKPKQKSNLGLPRTSTFDHDDGPEHASMRKRLSELTGMIKGVGNAREGAKDDQPAKPSSPYGSRPSMQSAIRTQTGSHQFQGPSGLYAAPSGLGRDSPGGFRPGEGQHGQGEDDREKKHGFLGGLFSRQGAKTQESKESKHSNQQQQQPPPLPQRPPQQFPMQPGPQFRPGQMPPPGQQAGPHPMHPGQPPIQEGVPAQQSAQRPTLPGSSHSNPLDIQSPTSPQFFGTAQAVMIRRPSEITVSQNQFGGTPMSPNQRPQTSQQGQQGNMRPGTAQGNDGRNPTGRPAGDDVFSMSSALPKEPPQLPRPSLDQSSIGGPSFVNRGTPPRKPVASGLSRQDGGSVTSTPTAQNSAPKPKSDNSASQPDSDDDETRLSSHLPSGQQSPTLGKLGHVRQTSLPSPGKPPMLPQPGQATSSAAGGSQFSPQGQSPSHDRPPPGQLQLFPQGQSSPSRPRRGSAGYSPPSDIGPQHELRQNNQGWGPSVSFADQQRSGQSYQGAQGQLPRPLAATPDQHSTLSKFFGVDVKGKSVAPIPMPKESKEKNAASRFLGAFKRGSKQAESKEGQSNQKPPPGHQTPPQPPRAQQGNAARPPISGPSPAGPLGPMSNLPQDTGAAGQGRGVPPQGAPGHGQMSPSMMQGAGRGEPQFQMQGGRGQAPQAAGLRRAPTGQLEEPYYEMVPIPRGYEAVHGYGNAGMLAPSPYNVGRPSHQPAQHQQYQPFVPQGLPQGAQHPQWDPRTMPNPQGIPYGQPPAHMQPGQQGLVPQHAQRQNDSASTTPTPSEKGTFLDMAPTPPPQIPRNDYRYDGQPVQNVPSHIAGGQQFKQPQVVTQAIPQQPRNHEAPTPTSSNWGSPPGSVQTPLSMRKAGPPTHNHVLQSKPSNSSVSPPSDGDNMQQLPHQHQHQHIATAMRNAHVHPTILQPGVPQNASSPLSTRPFAPAVAAPQRQLTGFSNQNPTSPLAQNATSQDASAGGVNNGNVDYNYHHHHLVSKASAPAIGANANASESPRPNAQPSSSLSPDPLGNRAISVSPEPRATPSPAPASYHHQPSNASLNINVDRANDPRENGSGGGNGAEDDIYDATPRVNDSAQMQGYHAQSPVQPQIQVHGHEQGHGLGIGQGQGQMQGQNIDAAHDNTKYGVISGGSGSVAAAGAAGAGMSVALGGGVGASGSLATSSTDTSSSSRSSSSNNSSQGAGSGSGPGSAGDPSPLLQQQQPAAATQVPAEAEEKILVDQPVELPVVNDDDDGIPVMSATSYPGQEWNPYGAGEFADLDLSI